MDRETLNIVSDAIKKAVNSANSKPWSTSAEDILTQIAESLHQEPEPNDFQRYEKSFASLRSKARELFKPGMTRDQVKEVCYADSYVLDPLELWQAALSLVDDGEREFSPIKVRVNPNGCVCGTWYSHERHDPEHLPKCSYYANDEEWQPYSYCTVCKKNFDGIGKCPHPEHDLRRREWEDTKNAETKAQTAKVELILAALKVADAIHINTISVGDFINLQTAAKEYRDSGQ